MNKIYIVWMEVDYVPAPAGFFSDLEKAKKQLEMYENHTDNDFDFFVSEEEVDVFDNGNGWDKCGIHRIYI